MNLNDKIFNFNGESIVIKRKTRFPYIFSIVLVLVYFGFRAAVPEKSIYVLGLLLLLFLIYIKGLLIKEVVYCEDTEIIRQTKLLGLNFSMCKGKIDEIKLIQKHRVGAKRTIGVIIIPTYNEKEFVLTKFPGSALDDKELADLESFMQQLKTSYNTK